MSTIGEKDFRRIFEFHNDYREEEPEDFKNKTDHEKSLLRKSSAIKGSSYVQESEIDKKDQEFNSVMYGFDTSVLTKIREPSSYLNRNDFEMFYLMFRFDSGFQAYRMMKWWPWLDFIATYGHLLTNLTIVI